MPRLRDKAIRRVAIVACVCFAVLAILGGRLAGCERGRPSARNASARPNVILILTDDHSWRALSTSGNQVIRTPTLQRLANEGTYFSRAYVPLPQCAPSRAALITGRYPHQNGVVSNSRRILNPRYPLISESLGQAGYRCGMMGKWHLGKGRERQGGFDDGWVVYDPSITPVEKKYTQPRVRSGGEMKVFDRWMGDVLTDYALDFIAAADDRPFFLWLAFHEPHTPITRNAAHPYEPSGVELPVSKRDSLESKPAAQRSSHQHDQFLRIEPALMRQRIADYYSMVSAVDANVGRILDRLRELRIEQDTLIVFMSDNGWLLGEHQLWGKGAMLYEELVRVPLIFRRPGTVPGGKRIDSLVTSLDLYPTLLELAGLSVPTDLPGKSLWPAILGNAVVHDEVFLEYRGGEIDMPDFLEPMLGVVTQRWKYTRYLHDGQEELYDLSADPDELINRANSNPAPELAQLRARVDEFQGGIAEEFWRAGEGGEARDDDGEK